MLPIRPVYAQGRRLDEKGGASKAGSA